MNRWRTALATPREIVHDVWYRQDLIPPITNSKSTDYLFTTCNTSLLGTVHAIWLLERSPCRITEPPYMFFARVTERTTSEKARKISDRTLWSPDLTPATGSAIVSDCPKKMTAIAIIYVPTTCGQTRYKARHWSQNPPQLLSSGELGDPSRAEPEMRQVRIG